MFCLLDRWWKRTVNLMTDRVASATGTFANLTWRKITRPQHLVLRAWSNTNTKQTTTDSQPQPPRRGDRRSPSGHERRRAADLTAPPSGAAHNVGEDTSRSHQTKHHHATSAIKASSRSR